MARLDVAASEFMEFKMKTYSFNEAAKILQTSETTLSGLLVNAIIPAAKIGQLWVILEENLEAYLRSEIQRQTMERLEFIDRGEKPKVATGSRRTVKPNLDRLSA